MPRKYSGRGRGPVQPNGGDCFFVAIIPQIQNEYGDVSVQELREIMTKMYLENRQTIVNTILESDRTLQEAQIESMLSDRIEKLRNNRYEWGTGLEFATLGIVLRRPIWTYKSDRVMKEFTHFSNGPLRLFHKGAYGGGLHWEQGFDYDDTVVSALTGMGYDRVEVIGKWEQLKSTFTDVGRNWSDQLLQQRISQLLDTYFLVNCTSAL